MAQTTFQKAEKLFVEEQFSKAKPLFLQHLKMNPGHERTREYLGDIAGYAKQWDTALTYYKPLVEAYPNNANYHFKVGGVLGMKALENKLKAITLIDDIKQHFETAARLDPKHIEARWALVEFYMQLPGIFGGSEKKAQLYAQQLQDISPVDGHLAKGYIAEYNEEPQEAERQYKKAIAVGGSPHTYEKLTQHYEKNNQPKQALKTASQSLKIHKRNRINYQIGKIVAQYNLDPQQGIAALQSYIENHTVRDGVPKDWAYYRLAQIYKNLGDKRQALQWIDKALADRPSFEEAQDEKRKILSL
jgi:tetratricopeptide (TPR) repeat protein